MNAMEQSSKAHESSLGDWSVYTDKSMMKLRRFQRMEVARCRRMEVATPPCFAQSGPEGPRLGTAEAVTA